MPRAITWVRVVGWLGNLPAPLNWRRLLPMSSDHSHSHPPGPPARLAASDKARLRRLLTEHFTIAELISELCFALDIDHEEFPKSPHGGGKSLFATHLIDTCKRSGRLHELLDLLKTARPHIQLGLDELRFAPNLQHDEVRNRYLERMIKGHTHLPLRGFPTRTFMSLSLEAIMVLPTVERQAHPAGPMTLSEMLRGHHRVLLVGGSGAGKTMLLSYLALRYARAALDNAPTVCDGDGNMLDTPRLPIVIQVVRYSHAINYGHGHTLMAFLQSEYETIGLSSDEMGRLLSDALTAGDALVLLDGLDDLEGTAHAPQILSEIERFVADIDDRNRVIATSRPTGYQPTNLAFDSFALCSLDRRQTQRLLRKWAAAVPNQSVSTQTGLAKLAVEIKRQPGIRQLSANPLLLTALILICINDQTLPPQRLILYQSIVRMLFASWAHSLALTSAHTLSELEMERLLGELAYRLRCGPSGDVAHEDVIRAWLIGALAACRDASPHNLKLRETVNLFFERLRYRAGMLVAVDARRYRFAPTPLQDYFAALHLTGLSNLDEVVAAQGQDVRWQSVIAFAVGQLSVLDPRRTARLIQDKIIDNPQFSQAEGVILALHCLGECANDTDPEFTAKLARQAVQAYLLLSNSDDAKSIKRRIEEEFTHIGGSPIGQVISSILTQHLANTHPPLQARAAEGLAMLGNAEPIIITGLINQLNNGLPPVRRSAARALGKLATSEDNTLQALLAGLNDVEPDIRETIVRSLGAIGEPSDALRNSLLPLLGDKALREHAINALLSIYQTNPELIAMAFSALQSPILAEGAVILIMRLTYLAEHLIKPKLFDVLHDPNPKIRKQAIRIIAHFGWVDPLSVQALSQVLWDRKLRGLAEDVLTNLAQGQQNGVENIRQALLTLMKNPPQPDNYALKMAQSILTKMG